MKIKSEANQNKFRNSLTSFIFSEAATETKREDKSAVVDSFSRNGDDGTSRILNGDILPKYHEIFHAIGATEELLSYLG